MKYALIGCGRIAKKHVEAAQKNGLEIAALCDKNKRKAKALAPPDAIAFGDYKAMLKSVCPRLVAIATDSGSHAEIAKHCIKSGANVIIEKPMALNLSDAQDIAKLAESHGVSVSVCHQNRFNYAAQSIKAALLCGEFGKISHAAAVIRWNRDKSYYNQAAWRGKWLSDGGALMNQCIHGIDMLRWLMDCEVKSVWGVCKNRFHKFIEAEDVGVAILEFQNGAIATIEGSTNIYPQNFEETISIFGENATVKLGGKAMQRVEYQSFKSGLTLPKTDESIENIYGNGHIRLYADTVLAIDQGRQPLVNAHEGLKATELVMAIYKSHLEQKAIALPLDSFYIKEMQAARL